MQQSRATSSASTTSLQQDLDKVQVQLPRYQFVLVFLAVCSAFMLSALDGTIVSTAIPTIIRDFGHQDQSPWVGSVFMLAAAASDAVWGKVIDVFGRRWPFLSAIFLFSCGSIWCGASNSMVMLICARALTGLGSGGITCLSVIVISDIVSMRDRGKYQSILGAIYGIASILGPVLGGIFSDRIDKVSSVSIMGGLSGLGIQQPLFHASYLHLVNDMTATNAGVQQFPNIVSSVLMTMLSGTYCSKFLSYVPFLYIGPVLMIIGSLLVSTFNISTTLAQQIGYLIVFGLGCGCLLQVRVLAIQASVRSDQVATVTALSNAFNAFGGSFGVALMGAISNNIFTEKVSENMQLMAFMAQIQESTGIDLLQQPLEVIQILKALPNQMDEIIIAISGIKDAFVDAFHVAFLSMIPFAAVIIILAIFVKDNMKVKLSQYTKVIKEDIELDYVDLDAYRQLV
ncbi:hypothetical protein HK100_009281 [Physocladia obscura]|uniref:Major facilitator superfamily (MFS) profile domain-containing protein n=1 Tax=Physocladia obscura TaxID=109957 RepID=A0AAD5T9E8_9FUNG|nr:hypothetical protein HK100_009281 [Physocladia obscura]